MLTGTSQLLPVTNDAGTSQPVTPPCPVWQRWGNQVVRIIKGNRAALMRAAGNNDVATIKRILSAPPSPHTVYPNMRYGKKNRTPAIKAAAHNNTEALSVLLDFGASARDVMTLSRWERKFTLFFDRQLTFYGYNEPVCHYTSQIIKVLLEDHKADPNTPYGIAKHAGTEMTSLEQLNMTSLKNWDPDETGRLSLQFARDPRTNLNSAINFNPATFFPKLQKKAKLKFPTFPKTPACINLLGQAFLFNNTPLIEYLLKNERSNPALPAGSAENLMVIVKEKLCTGYYYNFLPDLKAKLLNSPEFYEALISSPDSTFKQQFLTLFKIEPENRFLPYIDYSHCGHREMNCKIANLYKTFQPNFEGATGKYPGKGIAG